MKRNCATHPHRLLGINHRRDRTTVELLYQVGINNSSWLSDAQAYRTVSGSSSSLWLSRSRRCKAVNRWKQLASCRTTVVYTVYAVLRRGMPRVFRCHAMQSGGRRSRGRTHAGVEEGGNFSQRCKKYFTRCVRCGMSFIC